MFAAIRFKHLVIVGTLLTGVMLSPPAGYALLQLPPPPPTPRGCPVSGCSEGDSSGGSPGGAIGDLIRLPGDLIRVHKEAKATKITAISDKGVTAYQQKDWAAAEAYFKKALDLNPSDAVIRQSLGVTQNHEGEDAYRKGDYTTALYYFQQAMANVPEDNPGKHFLRDSLASTQSQIATVQREQEQRQQDKIAASKMQHSIHDLAQSLSATPSSNAAPASGGLDFNDGKSGDSSDKSSGLTFVDSDHPLKDAVADSQPAPGGIQPSQGASKCTFGTTCNPANPSLGSPPTDAAVTSNSTPEQLSSAAKSGKDAATAETLEKAKDLSNCQFDEKGCRTPDAINIPRPAQTPGAVELAKHIPPGRARDDKQIQQSMAYYQKLDGEKIGTKSKLEAVQKQIDSHAGDPTILNAQKATLSNDLKRYEGDQEKTQAQIKERLVTIGVKWDESPAPATGAKSNQ